MKKLIGLAAVAVTGALLYREYSRRKLEGDAFIVNLDNQVHNIIDEVGAKIDTLLSNIEDKLDEVEQEVEKAIND
ncbi:MAG: hypothetical protein GX775_02660 [Erysipelothrix sp.]|jgi:Mg2+ and Co2+ transporter CorA|nr:hypothetical protein [Erysipelothrix sp.]